MTVRFYMPERRKGENVLPITINVDTSDCMAKLQLLQAATKPERFERALYRIYSRTGKHVRRILKEDLPHDYAISPGKVSKAVMGAQIQGMGCIIPVRDKRGNIGSQYTASGGAHGWNSLKRKYKVKARIVKGGQSIRHSDGGISAVPQPWQQAGQADIHPDEQRTGTDPEGFRHRDSADAHEPQPGRSAERHSGVPERADRA